MSLLIFLVVFSVILGLTGKEWSIRPRTPLQWYILFSIVYYSYRWIFQWGSDATLYAQDAPGWVRIIKDLVFLAFVALMAWRAKFRYSPLLWYVLPIVLWFSVCGILKLLSQNAFDTLLYYWRYPLEYIPVAFIAFQEDCEELVRFGAGCCWLVIGFLGVEMLSGRPSGFALGGLSSRFGSSFGSPNDLGVFCGLGLLGLLVFRDQIGKATRVLLIPLLAGALILSGSRSAVVGFIAGLISLWPRSKRWLMVVALFGTVLWGVLFVSFRDTQFVDDLISRLGDESAMQRIEEVAQVKHEISNWNPGNALFGSWPYIHQEDFYLAVLLRSGFVGAAAFLLFAGMTVVRPTHSFLRAGVVSILVGVAFVPHFDVFPANFYFWLLAGAVWKLPPGYLRQRVLVIRTASRTPQSEPGL